MSEVRNALNMELKKSQAQFAYFQLGAAGSAIAYAVHETEGHSFHDTPWPMMVAVIFWGISFVLGCLGEDGRLGGMAVNVAYLDFVAKIDPVQRRYPGQQQALEELKQSVVRTGARPDRLFRWQLWTLFAGAMLYVAGHGMQMARTPSQRAPVILSSRPSKPLAQSVR